ncbi:MAG: hypothetical protein IT320_04400 [Anaerolineae bacterium]|nr:hypothetical protein [Anaerolineae bacterium]
MVALQLNARYDPDKDELEVVLPANFTPGKVTIRHSDEPEAEASYPREDMAWTDEEWARIQTLLQPASPKTGAEIAAQIREQGGGWENKGITDTLAWLDEQKRRRRERRKW